MHKSVRISFKIVHFLSAIFFSQYSFFTTTFYDLCFLMFYYLFYLLSLISSSISISDSEFMLSSSSSSYIFTMLQLFKSLSFIYNVMSFWPKVKLFFLFQFVNRRLNLQYHPFEALKFILLLNFLASYLISRYVLMSLFLIFEYKRLQSSLSVGLPPPYFRSHPFFFQRRRFRLGIPYYLDIYLTSWPDMI